MPWYYAGGEAMNHLARIANPDDNGVASHLYVEPPGDDSNPDSNLSDGRVGTAYRPDEGVFQKVASGDNADIEIALDKNMVANGECNDTATGWSYLDYNSAGGAASFVSGYLGRAGGQVKLTLGLAAYQDVTVRADEAINITASLVGDASVQAHALILEPQYAMNGSGVFVSGGSGVTWFTGGASWTTSTKTNVIIPSATVLGGPTATLRLIVWHAAGGTAYMDDYYCWPSTTFVGIFGHNLPLAALVTAYSDTVDSFASEALKATLTPTVPSAGAVIAVDHSRYWHIYIGNVLAGDFGTTNLQPMIGELVLTQVDTLPQTPTAPLETKWSWPGQIRYETRAGAKWVFNVSPYHTRELTLSFNTTATADPQGWVARNVRAWAGGGLPIIVIPPALGPAEFQLPLYGTVTDEQKLTWPSADTTYAQTEFTVTEEASAIF